MTMFCVVFANAEIHVLDSADWIPASAGMTGRGYDGKISKYEEKGYFILSEV
jgi:hypothetical protein